MDGLCFRLSRACFEMSCVRRVLAVAAADVAADAIDCDTSR